MIYAWINKEGILCATCDLQYVPEEHKDSVFVFDSDIREVNKLTVENGEIRLKTEEEILNERKQQKTSELKNYVAEILSQTDWVVTKLQSLKEEGWTEEEIEAEKQRYATVFQQRRAIREWNLQMKQAIKEAKTLEELEKIKIEFFV